MAEKTKKKKRAPIIRWWGILASGTRMVRLMVAVMLVVACAALAFTDLGFVHIGLPDEYAAYAIALLLPVALASLLLGTLIGTGVGIFAGVVLLAHSKLFPLDYFELTFVNTLTSVVMLGVSGFLLGVMFAFALRNNPSQIKRTIYIVIVCAIMSVLYSNGFIVNVFISLLGNLAMTLSNLPDVSESQTRDLAQEMAFTVALRMGNLNIQVLVDAACMAIFCVVGDLVARKGLEHADNLGIRGMFAVWLSGVVFAAFMVTAASSFVSISNSEIADAEEDMKSEATYLSNQLAHADDRANALFDLLVSVGIDLNSLNSEQVTELVRAYSQQNLLDGYSSKVDGTIFVLDSYSENNDANADGKNDASQDGSGYTIIMSDDDRFASGQKLSKYLDTEAISTIESCVERESLERIVVDENRSKMAEDLKNQEYSINSHIVYVTAKKVDAGIVVVMYSAKKVHAERGVVMAWTTFSSFILLFAVFVITYLLLSRLIVRKIDETNEVLENITAGDLEASVTVRRPREFASLSDGINKTVSTMKGWIAKAETRMDAELATAKAIQESALPRTFPPYPDIRNFDIYASMNAAREVGGDFYDFFLIGDTADHDACKLGFVIADVSGKGVPASLFMMKAKTQIRDYLASGMELGEAVENANHQLCDGNDAGMFVTVWVGVLDYKAGHIEYVNAGHNPPLMWNREFGWRWLTEKSGMPLGLFDGFGYEAFSVDCIVGDELLLYTDGVTEAMSASDELYGEERLKALAEENFTLHPRALVEAVRGDVARHARGAEQSDDITILALEYGVPPELTATLVVPADVDELPRVNEFIHTELDRRLCPLRVQNQLDIAVEELFVNVARYAYPDATPKKPGSVRVSYTYSADPPSIVVDIADDGIPYDPLAKPDAVTPEDIMDVPIGGLGILMAKRSVNEMRYERLDGSNIVTIVKKW